MDMLKAKDIFTPGGFPSHTFVDDHLTAKHQVLRDTIDTGTMLISISGPSKSGKTVFVEQSLGKEKIIQVTGAGINSIDILWTRIFDQIGIDIPTSRSSTSSSTNGFTVKLSASGSLIFAKAEAEGSAAHQDVQGETLTFNRPTDYLQILINTLKELEFVIFIDDFHYISRDIQTEIARQIKEAIRQGVTFIVASVPYHSDDVIRGNPDLRGRIVNIDFSYWNRENLTKIADLGFNALGIEHDDQLSTSFAEQAAGSPQLMQQLCLNACFEYDMREQQPPATKLPFTSVAFEKICRRVVLSADYSSTVEKMLEGPRVRGSDRIRYILKDGHQGDVYSLIMRCLATDPPRLTLRYDDLTAGVRGLCNGSSPSGSSITGACSHIAKIANDSANANIIEWDSESEVLDIRDPYLLFYIRWGDIFTE